MRSIIFRLFAAAFLAAGSMGMAADGVMPDAVPESPLSAEQNTVQSLEALQRSLAAKESELAGLQQELAAADDLTREDVRARAVELRQEVDEQRRQFEQFATDIDLSPFTPAREPEKFDWQEQVGKLLEPIMAEIENATAESRAVGELRGQLAEVGKKKALAEEAVANLDRLLAQSPSAELAARLTVRRDTWSRILEQAANEYTALDLQLQSRLAARESVLDQSTRYARHFFQTRGMNLLLGVLAFCAVFFGFRLVAYLVHRARQGADRKSFSSRLTALLFHVFSILGGMLAMLVVFNLVGDWFLLGIVVIFLFGVGWASINTLPQQVETIKLMLNIGAVKEGEALVYEGLPYRVDALGFSARLNNPLLDGGVVIVPVKYLVGMHSRKPGEREAWFPCREGDWVELADGVTGRVVSQTPGAVQVVQWGGARTTYATPAFLAQRPRNLSAGFRIEDRFGLDYRHQAEAVDDIPALMQQRLIEAAGRVVDPALIQHVEVTLAGAGTSALEFAIAIDLKGEAAERAREVRLAIPRALVALCGEKGWTIPYQHVVVHQARA